MNYNALGRTNYFRVKDEQKFRDWAARQRCLELVEGTAHTFCLLADEGFQDDPDTGVLVQYALIEHIAPGDVAIITESGHEGLRYTVGWAISVTSEGEVAAVDTCSIYALTADKLNRPIDQISRAEY